MRIWLINFFKDLGDLSKPQFFQKYILPGLALFFTWGIVGHLFLLSLDTNSLIKNTGQVSEITIKIEQGTNKYFPLKIRLTNYNVDFRIPDTYKNYFPYLQKRIFTSDTITLFTRHKWQSILGWGEQMDIFQIEKDGKTLFDISKVIEEKKSQATILTTFCIILWPWYFIYRRRRKNFE